MQCAQLNQRVRRALETLSPLDRALGCSWAAATDKSHDDIARELCIKPACVRAGTLCRARKRLRERLASHATNNLGDPAGAGGFSIGDGEHVALTPRSC